LDNAAVEGISEIINGIQNELLDIMENLPADLHADDEEGGRNGSEAV